MSPGTARYPPLWDWFGRYFLNISTLTVTLTLRTAIKNCHKTLHLVIMHHYTMYGCKGLRNSGKMEQTAYFLRISTHSVALTSRTGTHFSHDTPDDDDTLTYQVSLQKVAWFRRLSLEQIFPQDLNP